MNAFRDETMQMCRTKGWDRASINSVWLLLTEEVGELASAIRQSQRTFKKTGLKKERGTDVQMELADVLSYLFQIAGMLRIDLDSTWEKHRKKIEHRKYNLS